MKLVVPSGKESTEVNKHIDNYIEYYCSYSGHQGFAILLSGDWGAGKTHFIKKKIDMDKERYLYISLYGLEKLSQIEDQLFQQLHPTFSSDYFSLGSKLLGHALKVGVGLELEGEQLKKFMKMSTDKIIVFDDLERCKIDIGDVLGHINSYVEQRENKVIIIGNEEVLLKDYEGEFKQTKEKLIGRTFAIKADVKSALPTFIDSLNNEDVKNFLRENTESIFNIYQIISINNLRSLKVALEEFERFYTLLPNFAQKKEIFLKDCLDHILPFVFEIRKGTLSPDDILELPRVYFESSIKDKGESDGPRSFEEKFLHKYREISIYNPCLNLGCWRDFLKDSYIADDFLLKSLSESKYFMTEESPDWVKLWYFRNLNNKSFKEQYELVFKRFMNLEYQEPGELKHISGLLFFFSELGLIKETPDVLSKMIQKNLSIMNDKGLINSQMKIGHEFGSYAGLGFAGSDSDHFKKIAEVIDHYTLASRDIEMKEHAKTLLELVKSDPRMFWSILSPKMESEIYYYDISILNLIDPVTFVSYFLSLVEKDRDLIGYGISDRLSPCRFKCELEWLGKVRQLLIEHSTKLESLEKYLLLDFSERVLDKILSKD
jgi:hypothetical protein